MLNLRGPFFIAPMGGTRPYDLDIPPHPWIPVVSEGLKFGIPDPKNVMSSW